MDKLTLIERACIMYETMYTGLDSTILAYDMSAFSYLQALKIHESIKHAYERITGEKAL